MRYREGTRKSEIFFGVIHFHWRYLSRKIEFTSVKYTVIL